MTAIDQNFERIERQFELIHAEIAALRHTLIQIGFSLTGVLLAAIVALILAIVR